MQRDKKVCLFYLLENSRPLSPWRPLDFLSTCLGNESLLSGFSQGREAWCMVELKKKKKTEVLKVVVTLHTDQLSHVTIRLWLYPLNLFPGITQERWNCETSDTQYWLLSPVGYTVSSSFLSSSLIFASPTLPQTYASTSSISFWRHS